MFNIKRIEKTLALSLFFFTVFFLYLTHAQTPWISITLNFSAVDFGTLQTGSSNNPAVNNYEINVTSGDGCVGQVTFYSPSPLANGSYTIPNTNFKFNYTLNTTAYPTLLTFDVNRTIDVNNSFIYPEYYLDIPVQQYAGLYTSTQIIEGGCV